MKNFIDKVELEIYEHKDTLEATSNGETLFYVDKKFWTGHHIQFVINQINKYYAQGFMTGEYNIKTKFKDLMGIVSKGAYVRF